MYRVEKVAIWVLERPGVILDLLDRALEGFIEFIQLRLTVPARCQHGETKIAVRELGVIVTVAVENGVAKECHACRIARKGGHIK